MSLFTKGETDICANCRKEFYKYELISTVNGTLCSECLNSVARYLLKEKEYDNQCLLENFNNYLNYYLSQLTQNEQLELKMKILKLLDNQEIKDTYLDDVLKDFISKQITI